MSPRSFSFLSFFFRISISSAVFFFLSTQALKCKKDLNGIVVNVGRESERKRDDNQEEGSFKLF